MPDQSLLIVSLVALAVGPLVYQAARAGGGYMVATLDGFVYAAIGGLVLIHLLPESFLLGGWLALAGGAIGLFVPSMVEHRLGRLARKAHAIALLLGLTAIALHAFMDGLALTTADSLDGSGQRHMLPMAVILHRLPVGLTVWFLLRPQYGVRTALACLALICIATTTGYASGETVHTLMESRARGVFQAIVAGSLLHVLLHRSYPIPDVAQPGRGRLLAGLGALAGIALIWFISASHDTWPRAAATWDVFYSLFLQSAPALLLAYLAAGIVYGLMPRTSFDWLGRGSHLSQATRGVTFGLPLPVCSCGVVPLYRSLLVQGVPATAGMAFLVATPELSLDAILISLPLLGVEFTAVRVVAAVVVALTIGWGLGRFAKLNDSAGRNRASREQETEQGPGARLRAITDGTVEVLETTAPWILVGLGVAAGIGPLLEDGWINSMAGGFDVELFALLGMPMYVCASGATPLVAILIATGVSPGAGLAFLLTGPATNITTFGVLQQLHGRRIAFAFGVTMTLLAVVLGRAVNGFLNFDRFPLLVHEHETGVGLQEICLLAVALLFLFTFLRKGPRGFVGELFDMADDDGEQACGSDSEDGNGHFSGDFCCHDDALEADSHHDHVHGHA